MYRKFNSEEPESGAEDEAINELDVTLPMNGPGRLKRSSIKPRLLFPPKPNTRITRSQATDEDEEAITDIEEPLNVMSTPKDLIDEDVATPKAPKFAPVSPPTTTRATRSKKIAMSSSPAGPTSDDELAHGSGRNSPLNDFSRRKPDSKSKKRSRDSLMRSAGSPNKKLRA